MSDEQHFNIVGRVRLPGGIRGDWDNYSRLATSGALELGNQGRGESGNGIGGDDVSPGTGVAGKLGQGRL